MVTTDFTARPLAGTNGLEKWRRSYGRLLLFNHNFRRRSNAVKQFIRNHQAHVMGSLHGFDRIRFRGTQRWLANERGMNTFLGKRRVLLKDFKSYALKLTRDLRQHLEALAERCQRPSLYLNSTALSKEDLARRIAQDDRITGGMIGLFRCVEPCFSYEVRPNASTKHLELRRQSMKCLHYYLYFIDPLVGFGHLRLQTWFPFTMHVCVNGREWLCRELDRRKIGYVRRGNCVVAVEDFAAAQNILDLQVTADWQGILNRLATWAFPLHRQLLDGEPMHYYWSADDTEWASDLLFRSPQQLAQLYPQLLQHGMRTFSSGDVLRFLGRKVPAHGQVHGTFAGEVLTDLRRRPEGVRIKHRLNKNSIKMYDKQGSVLRVETTITHARDIKVYRRVEGQPDSPLAWRKLRKGVSDLPRRAQVSQAANGRYLDALSAVEATTPLKALSARLCRSITWQGRSVRGLRPLEAEDRVLLEAVMRGEFAINGFRNGDLRAILFGTAADEAAQRRQSAQVTRRLRMLRAHRLIRKVSTTHRYVLTTSGRTAITAFLTALNCDTKQLNQLAA